MTTDEQDAALRICSRVGEIPAPVADSEVRQCAECGADVWFCTTQSHGPEYDHLPTVILCGVCGLVRILMEGGKVMNITEDPIDVVPIDEKIKELFSDEH